MSIILYKMDLSPPARTVMVTAEILGLDIKTREVNLREKEHLNPDFVEKNPMHTIPLLEDGDFILADSHAIITYLTSKYRSNNAAAELYPDDVQQRAIIHQRLFLDASILFPRLHVIVKAVAYDKATCVNEKKQADVEEAYGFLDKYLQESSYLAGKHLTIADISCVTTVSSLELVVPINEKYQKLRKWLSNLKNKNWYVTKNQPGVDDLHGFFTSTFQKNKQAS